MSVKAAEQKPSRSAPPAERARPPDVAETAPQPDAAALALRLSPAGAPADGGVATGGSGSSAFIVEDEATPSHTQMRKSDFLEAARASICAAANEELVAAGRTADGCPYVERWVAYYGLQSAERMNRALRLYAPESATAHSASQAVPLLVARIRAGVRTWVTTGRVEGVPTESAANAAPPVRTSSGGRPAADGAAVIEKIGAGRPLSPPLRTRMEGMLGAGLGHVRVHTDSSAAATAGSLGARAFAVGEHIGFESGSFAPGTIAGDALLAHELAHTLQADSLGEGEAEREAMSAAASVAHGRPVARRGRSAASGLQLRRCADVQQTFSTSEEQLAFELATATDSWSFDATAILDRLQHEDPEVVRKALELLKLRPHARDVNYFRRLVRLMRQGLTLPVAGPGDPWGDAQRVLGIDPQAGPAGVQLSPSARLLYDSIRFWTPSGTMGAVSGSRSALDQLRAASPEDAAAVITLLHGTWDNTYGNELNRLTAQAQTGPPDQYRELIRFLHDQGFAPALSEADPQIGLRVEEEANLSRTGRSSNLSDDQMAGLFGTRALEIAFTMLRESEGQILGVLSRTQGGGPSAEALDTEVTATLEVINRHFTPHVRLEPSFEDYASGRRAALSRAGQPVPSDDELRRSYNRDRQIMLYRIGASGDRLLVHEITQLDRDIREADEELNRQHVVYQSPFTGPGPAWQEVDRINAHLRTLSRETDRKRQRRDALTHARNDVERVLPLLGGLDEEQLRRLAALTGGAAEFDRIRDATLARIFGNIEQARRDLWEGQVSIWLLPQVVDRTRAQFGIEDPAQNDTQRRWLAVIASHREQAHADEARVHKILEILNAAALIVALGTALFTGGGSVALYVGLAGEGLGLGTSVYNVVDAARRTEQQATLYGTALTADERLSDVPPDLGFLHSAWMALGINVALSAFTLRSMARPALLQGEEAAVRQQAQRLARQLRAAGAEAGEEQIVEATMTALQERGWVGGAVRGVGIYDVSATARRLVDGTAGSLEREVNNMLNPVTGGGPARLRGARLESPGGTVTVPSAGGAVGATKTLSQYQLVVPVSGGADVRVAVTFEALPGSALPPGPHVGPGGAAASGPARLDLARDATSGAWNARIRFDQGLRPADVSLVAGHELDEISEIVARSPTATAAEIAAQQESSLFRPGGIGGAPTAHDLATVEEIRRLVEEAEAPGLSAATRAARTARLERLLRASGFADSGRAARLGALTGRVRADQLASLEVRSERLAFEASSPIARSATLARDGSTLIDNEFIDHMLNPRPQGSFSSQGLYGGHVTSRLRAFETANPQYALEEVQSVAAGGTTFRKFKQWRWNGTGAPPAVGNAARPGGTAFNPANWELSTASKTAADDLQPMLQQGEDAWIQWRTGNIGLATSGGSNAWGGMRPALPTGTAAPAAVSESGVEFSGFFQYTPASSFAPATWRMITLFPWMP